MKTRLAALVVIGLSVAIGLSWPARPAGAQDIGALFQKVNPSVVVIRARGRDVSSPVSGLTYFSEVGSGVLISDDGKVMTAAHVVHAMDEISVEFMGEEPVAARVIASEPAADVSLIHLERVPSKAVAARLGNSDAARVGDQVIVVGAPYGLGHSLSVGWISAKYPPNTVYKAMPLAEFLQTTATINQGNSGGPMFNMAGEVIGIVSHNISKSGGSEGLGFTVTAKTAHQLLLERRAVWSGLDGMLLTGELAEIFNVPQPAGYLIKTVAKDSPGWEMGLRGGDRVATIGGQQVVVRGDILLTIEGIQVGEAENYQKIRERLTAMQPGQPVRVTVLRAGRVLELTGRAP
jgi:serine protease Do